MRSLRTLPECGIATHKPAGTDEFQSCPSEGRGGKEAGKGGGGEGGEGKERGVIKGRMDILMRRV